VYAAGRYGLKLSRPIPRQATIYFSAPRLFDIGILVQAGEQTLRQPRSLASWQRKSGCFKIALS
jgi:hypothetical protein